MDPFLGEIRLLANDYAPTGWALCNGAPMPVRSATSLFAILGVTYGGDGVTTFNLPDLRDRVPVAPGQLPGGAYYNLGETGGVVDVTLTTDTIPSHNHTWQTGRVAANAADPTATTILTRSTDGAYQAPPFQDVATMDIGAITRTGNSGSHPNLQPYLVLNYYIALQGIWPPRS